MKIIENSKIVNWDIYPEFICAVVMVSNRDVVCNNGLTMPSGEEVTWLLDKSPSIGDDFIIKNAKINCLGGIGVFGDGSIDFFDVKELHFKPKPIVRINQFKEMDNSK